MADVTRRRTGELLRALFEILIQSPEGLQARDALAALASRVELTEFEKGTYATGGRRFDKIIRFATIDCAKAGWFLKAKGQWSVTDAGKEAFRIYKDPETFYREAVKLYNLWRTSQPDALPSQTVGESDDNGKATSITFEEAEEQAWAEISQYLAGMLPYDFQDLVAGLVRAMGYHIFWVAPPGKDGGVDILAGVDPFKTRPPTIKIQVKRQQDPVRVDGLRAFMSVLGDDDVGIFVCIGGFTKDASDEARSQERRKVTLINLDELLNLWIEYYAKLSDDSRKRLPLRPIYFLSPDT